MSALAAMPQPQPDVLTVVIRDAGGSDWPFIKDSWASSLRGNKRSDGDDLTPTDAPLAHGWYRKIKERVSGLRMRGATFLVACDPTDTSQIIGWVCFEKPVLHYVFVKIYFRGQGIARQLIAPMADQKTLLCSAWTGVCSKISRSHPGILRKVLPC